MSKKYHYNKLKEVLTLTRVILEDVSSASGIELSKSPASDRGKKVPKDVPYKDKKSAVMNFATSTQKADDHEDIFIQTGYKLLDKAKKVGEDAQFKMKEMVVDLTKLSNELKEIGGMDDKKVDVDRIRKVLRYVDTAMTNSNKTIKELNEKRAKMEDNIDFESYEKELSNLQSKYGLNKIDDIDDEVSEVREQSNNNAKEIENENKEIIRAFRSLLGELYDVPKEMANVAKMHLKAYGALATVSPNTKELTMKRSGILKILNDKELNAKLGEFIAGGGRSADKVKVVGASIPKIGTYFAELTLKMDQELSEVSMLEDEFEKSEKVKNEAFMPKIFDRTKKIFLKSVSKFFTVLRKETHILYQNVKKSLKPMVKELSDIDKDMGKFRKDADQNYLKVQKMLRELDIELITKAEKLI